MMTEPNETASAPDSFGDLPLQPTGSGVADLEIAYEQMKLTDDDAGPAAGSSIGDMVPTLADRDGDAAQSEAHPS